jgi:nucleotide-binding universal stress UspA family protein
MEEVLRTGLDRVPEALPVDGRLLLGPAATEIAAAASDHDLLAVGSRGHGAFGRTLLGSVSTELIHRAECPVIVLPRGTGGLSDWGR